jgi:hypothetical protein
MAGKKAVFPIYEGSTLLDFGGATQVLAIAGFECVPVRRSLAGAARDHRRGAREPGRLHRRHPHGDRGDRRRVAGGPAPRRRQAGQSQPKIPAVSRE